MPMKAMLLALISRMINDGMGVTTPLVKPALIVV